MSTNEISSYQGHGAESLDTTTVEQYAPPALDPEEARTIEKCLDIRSPSVGQLSPDGNHLFVGWTVTGKNQIWKVPGPKRFPIQMTGGKEGTSLAMITPDGKSLILMRDQGGDEYPGIYLQNTSGGPLQTLFYKEKVHANPFFVSQDSEYLYFSANDMNPQTYSLYRCDLQSGAIETIYHPEDGTWLIDDLHEDGTLLLIRMRGTTINEYYIFSPEDHDQPQPLFGQNESEDYEASFSQYADHLLVLTNRFSDFKRLYHYSLNSCTFEPITPDWSFDIKSMSIDKQRSKIFLTLNQNAYLKPHILDAETFDSLELPFESQSNILHSVYGNTTPDGRYSTFGIMYANKPSASFVHDWHQNKQEQWVEPSCPEMDTSDYVTPIVQSYPARDGTQIPLIVYAQQWNTNYPAPVIVDVHGGPEGQEFPRFSPVIQHYLSKGFHYVAPNVRGSSGYGKHWINADNGPKRLDVITDIEDLALYLKKAWAVNGQAPKIGIKGGSYGGYATLYAMTKFADHFDAGVSTVGISNLISFLQNTAPYRRKLRMAKYGDPEHDREALEKLSPINHLDQMKQPLMLIHGVNDPRVPPGESYQIYQKLREKDIPSELILFPDEGHGIGKRKNQVLAIGHTLRFFEKHLKE